jgi:hypothetical protein
MDFSYFKMLFVRLDESQRQHLLIKYNIKCLDDFNSLLQKNKELITIEANTQLYNNIVSTIRNYSIYDLCLLYNYVKKG